MQNIFGSVVRPGGLLRSLTALSLLVVWILSLGVRASAQVVPDPTSGLMWSSVNNCPQANAFGPQVYTDVEADQPDAEEELLQLNNILVHCQQATATTASPSYTGPSAIETILAALRLVLALERQWYILHHGVQGAPTAPQGGWRGLDPATRQIRYVPARSPAYVAPTSVRVPAYFAPRPAPVYLSPRPIPVYVPPKAYSPISRLISILRRR